MGAPLGDVAVVRLAHNVVAPPLQHLTQEGQAPVARDPVQPRLDAEQRTGFPSGVATRSVVPPDTAHHGGRRDGDVIGGASTESAIARWPHILSDALHGP